MCECQDANYPDYYGVKKEEKNTPLDCAVKCIDIQKKKETKKKKKPFIDPVDKTKDSKFHPPAPSDYNKTENTSLINATVIDED